MSQGQIPGTCVFERCGTAGPLERHTRFLAVEQPGPEKEELIGDCIVPALHKVLQAIEGKKTPYGNVLRALLLYLGPRRDGETESEDLSCRPSSSSLFPILP